MFTASDLIYSQRAPIIDPEDVAEVVRQRMLSDLITPVLGSLLPETEDFSRIEAVLDLACGQGCRALDLAFAHPDIDVAGIDLSRVLIDAANAHARDQYLTNASFGVVDLTRPPFDFSDGTFDLINACFLQRCLEETQWPPLLHECHRLLKPGGFIRVIECESGLSNSEAIEALSLRYTQALRRADLRTIPANRFHDLAANGAVRKMLVAAGLPVYGLRRGTLDFSAQQPARTSMQQIIAVFFELVRPFVLRMGTASEAEYARLVQQAAYEIPRPTFEGRWHLLTLWGRKQQAGE